MLQFYQWHPLQILWSSCFHRRPIRQGLLLDMIMKSWLQLSEVNLLFGKYFLRIWQGDFRYFWVCRDILLKVYSTLCVSAWLCVPSIILLLLQLAFSSNPFLLIIKDYSMTNQNHRLQSHNVLSWWFSDFLLVFLFV